MRIHRLRLENYRGITERDVTFPDTGIIVVEGANEVGKTSMIQALDLLLDKPDSSKSREVTAVKPVTRDVGSVVEAEISTGQYRFTYLKQWNRGTRTELRVTAPTDAQFTGAAAHAEVQRMLDETLDRDLYRTLRILQAEELSSATLSGSRALSAALDAAAGSASHDGEGDSLIEAVDAEYFTFWTKTGKETGAHAQARTLLSEAEAQLAEASAALGRVADDVSRHATLTSEITSLEDSRTRALAEVETYAAQWESLRGLRDQVEGARRTLAERSRSRSEHVAAMTERGSQSSALAAREQHLEQLSAQLTEARVLLHESKAELTGLETRAAEVEERGRSAREQADLATEDAEHLQDVVDAERLRRSLELIAGLQSTIEGCETALADSVLTEEILETIDGALTDLRVSESHRDASAAQLVIERLSDVAVEVDGERLDGEVGSWVSQAVTRDVELVVPGVLRARLSPARDSGDLDAAVAAAQERLGAALRKGKVTDRAQARIALDRDRETRARRDQARATLRDELGERSVSEISADLARLTARMESYTAAVGDRALPSGVPEARDRVRELQAVEREARAGAGKVTGARDTARERVSAHTLSCTTLETKLAIEEAEVAERRTRLQTAREHLSDHALEAAEAEAIAAESVARSELQELEVRLAAENADQLESLRTNAVALVGRLTGELTTMTEDARNLKVSLELRGQQGLRETFDLAQSLVEARRGEFERINARALAAQLLFEVLHRHQDTARQRYIAPFRDRVVALGQIVYGGDFDVRVGEDLAIEARTLAGATVEFGHLSAGAQEQLAIITRLACAGLVDEVDGVPVIIDDAMGYSDPARLHKMNAMISTLQSASQVILLTCTPQRYRSIGAAHVIKLEPAGAAAAVS